MGQPKHLNRKTRWTRPQRPTWPGASQRVAGGRTSVSAPLGLHRRVTVPLSSRTACIRDPAEPPRHPVSGSIRMMSSEGRTLGFPIQAVGWPIAAVTRGGTSSGADTEVRPPAILSLVPFG